MSFLDRHMRLHICLCTCVCTTKDIHIISLIVFTFINSYWCVLRREFSGMIPVITSNVIIPATPSNPSIPCPRP